MSGRSKFIPTNGWQGLFVVGFGLALLLIVGCGKSPPDLRKEAPPAHPLPSTPLRQYTPTEIHIRNAKANLDTIEARLNKVGRGLSHLADIEIPDVVLHPVSIQPGEPVEPIRFDAVTWRQYIDDWNADGWQLRSFRYRAQNPDQIDTNPLPLNLDVVLRAPDGSMHTEGGIAIITWGDSPSGMSRLELHPMIQGHRGK